MTVAQLQKELDLTLLAGSESDRPVEGCYIGDLLSWVMGRAGEGCVWITVMGNVNAVAVAKLADISCILLCESAHLDDEAREQAQANGIPIFGSEQTAYELAVKIAGLL